MRGIGIDAIDGPIGEIHDVYFDDHDWRVRYYIVNTGKWLPGREVLIPPQAVRHTPSPHGGLPVDLTREQVRNSPDVDTDRPVSRQTELALHRHYGWTPYWLPIMPAIAVTQEGDTSEHERGPIPDHEKEDPNLRSARDVIGYHVAATDGGIGHIDDFLLDDEQAKIRYAVVDTRNWLPGRSVLIAPQWIREVRWAESKVLVSVTREAVRHSPEYNPLIPIDKEYEDRIYKHYGYPELWI
jgi:uncharacterized protein YrrD